MTNQIAYRQAYNDAGLLREYLHQRYQMPLYGSLVLNTPSFSPRALRFVNRAVRSIAKMIGGTKEQVWNDLRADVEGCTCH